MRSSSNGTGKNRGRRTRVVGRSFSVLLISDRKGLFRNTAAVELGFGLIQGRNMPRNLHVMPSGEERSHGKRGSPSWKLRRGNVW